MLPILWAYNLFFKEVYVSLILVNVKTKIKMTCLSWLQNNCPITTGPSLERVQGVHWTHRFWDCTFLNLSFLAHFVMLHHKFWYYLLNHDTSKNLNSNCWTRHSEFLKMALYYYPIPEKILERSVKRFCNDSLETTYLSKYWPDQFNWYLKWYLLRMIFYWMMKLFLRFLLKEIGEIEIPEIDSRIFDGSF